MPLTLHLLHQTTNTLHLCLLMFGDLPYCDVPVLTDACTLISHDWPICTWHTPMVAVINLGALALVMHACHYARLQNDACFAVTSLCSMWGACNGLYT